MSFVRSLFLNRISGQMAILILVSLLAIHVVITAGIFLSHRWDNSHRQDENPAEIVTLARLVAAAAPAERAPLLAQIARAFPHVEMRTAAAG